MIYLYPLVGGPHCYGRRPSDAAYQGLQDVFLKRRPDESPGDRNDNYDRKRGSCY